MNNVADNVHIRVNNHIKLIINHVYRQSLKLKIQQKYNQIAL